MVRAIMCPIDRNETAFIGWVDLEKTPGGYVPKQWIRTETKKFIYTRSSRHGLVYREVNESHQESRDAI